MSVALYLNRPDAREWKKTREGLQLSNVRQPGGRSAPEGAVAHSTGSPGGWGGSVCVLCASPPRSVQLVGLSVIA